MTRQFVEEPTEKGNPDHVTPPWEKQYIGVDKPKVDKHYQVAGRGEGWPWARDVMDYDPAIDEDLESNDG